MRRTELNDAYFDWMYQTVLDEEPKSYQKLLYLLNETEFTYIIPMDGNRYEDGISLRYRFGYSCDVDEVEVARYLDDKPCSVLEMMVALAIRIEEHIMRDPDIGDRTGEWFWVMISSLGLETMDDFHFDEKYSTEVIQNFLDRDYAPNGDGGLFRIDHCDEDLRNVEIWYQANWYLNTIE